MFNSLFSQRLTYRRGHSLFILVGRSFRNLRVENKQKEVPRFFYIYTNGAFGANFPQQLKTMKKLSLLLLTLTVCFFTACHKDIWAELENLDQRVTKLEELCKEMNTNITSLQTIVSVLQSNDYITGIVEIKKNGEVIGYTITFGKHDPITIYHGQNGADGKDGQDGSSSTPVIGVAQDTDGVYYWTLNGEWLLDDNGNKLPVSGTNGKDGQNGSNGQDGTDGKDGQDGTDGKDGVTPQLKIEDGYWYISYDNGATWTQLGKATGEDGKDGQNGSNGTNGKDGKDGQDGDSMFQSVTQDDDYVYFTLADGTVIKIAKGSGSNDQPNENDIIEFKDLAVKAALLKLGVDTTKDNEISYGEAAAYSKDLIIKNNKQIHSFKEFKFFTNTNIFTFEGCTNLFEISLPDNLKNIDQKAFYGCSSLLAINIPNSVTSLGENIFHSCTSLSSVNIPNNVTKISQGMFYGCSSLESIDIPDNIITIEEEAFNGCTSLSVINMSNGVVKIGTHAFSGCKTFVYPEKLSFSYPTYFYTPSLLTSVYWNTISYSSLDNGLGGTSWRKGIIFATTGAYENYSIEKVIIGDKVQHIPDVMCYGLKSLTEITIPSSVTSIGYNPFDNCSNLKHIYCKASTPPTSSSTLYFPNSVIAIYVPAASLGDYLTSWSDYADKIVGYDFE